MDRNPSGHRVLPGDMVTFQNLLATNVMIVKTAQPRPRNFNKQGLDLSFTDDSEKNRLADMLEVSKAVSGRMVYLVIAASKKRAFLLRSDTMQRIVALTEDLHFIC